MLRDELKPKEDLELEEVIRPTNSAKRLEIEDQVAAFLASGGKINIIEKPKQSVDLYSNPRVANCSVFGSHPGETKEAELRRMKRGSISNKLYISPLGDAWRFTYKGIKRFRDEDLQAVIAFRNAWLKERNIEIPD